MRSIVILSLGTLALTGCSEDRSERAPPADAEGAEAPQAAADLPPGAGPSFDCDRAEGQAQQLVCNNRQLAAMDRELDRLFRLAQGDGSLDGKARQQLRAYQRGWIKGRDECWKADDLHPCVVGEYAMRIHELRRNHAAARSQDEEGRSMGPFALACEGIDAGIAVTYVNVEPAIAYLAWSDRMLTLGQTASGSGARYGGRDVSGEWTFWTKGEEALLEGPDIGERKCRFDATG